MDQKSTFLKAVQEISEEEKHQATALLSSLLPFLDNFVLIAGWLRGAMTSHWQKIQIPIHMCHIGCQVQTGMTEHESQRRATKVGCRMIFRCFRLTNILNGDF